MRIAIVHDWLNGMRGGEKVLEALLQLYPDATIYTLFHQQGKVSPAIEARPIVTSWIDRVPGIYAYYRNLLPLFPSAVESWNFMGFDLIISSSHCVAKGIRPGSALHISYCHTPMRYIWDSHNEYRFRMAHRAGFVLFRTRLQRWDRETSSRVHHFVANSRFVSERIHSCYGRTSTVIHPPVDTDYFTPDSSVRREDFYLCVGALVPYKRVDLVISAFNNIGKRLIVVGGGSERSRLRKMARSNVQLLGWVPDHELRELYQKARGLIFAACEDFGIVPVEGRACGCPVIAFGAGGVLETVAEGTSGTLFREQQAESLTQAVKRFETMSWSQDQVRSGVEKFSRETFERKIGEFVRKKIQERQERPEIASQLA